jgi:hypothetical protein
VIILLAVTAWFGPIVSAQAGTAVRILETWPAGEKVVLGRNQNFYLRLAYDTDKPAGIWVAPYFQGRRVNAGSNPSQTYSGSGETFGWFFFVRPGDAVDEIRITAGDGSLENTPVVATWHGQMVGGSQSADAEAPPAWVADMRGRAKAAQDKAYQERMSKPVGVGEVALFNGFMLAMLALGLSGFAAPAWGLWCWRGGWRLAAALPAAMITFVVLRIVFDTARDPTSHNLWPFEIVQAGLISVAAMAVLGVVHRLSGAGR